MIPLTFAEDVEQRKRMQGMTVMSPGGMLSSSVQPGQALPMSMRARLGKVYQDLDALDAQDVDTSALQAFARQQGEQGQTAMLNALAAQYAGENFQPVQAQFLKRAMAAQEPMRLGQGMLTPDGQYLKDPFAARDTRRAALERQATVMQGAIDRQERDERDRQDRLQQQGFINQIRTDMLNLRRDQLSNKGEPGNYSPSGFTPNGQQVVTNSKTGMSYLIGMTPDGQPTYTPYMGSMIPKITFDKNVGVVQDALASANRADFIINQVDANPDAFGMTASLVSRLPQLAQGRVAAAVLAPETMKLRSDVLKAAAMEISSLYGAALSLGEQARANTFIPNQDDGPEAIIAKLKAARDWAKSTAQQYGSGVLGAAQARSSGGQVAPAPAAGSLSVDEQAEYERLKEKYGR